MNPPEKKKKRSLQGTLNAFKTKKPATAKLFCDLDGVLVDFSKGVKKLTGHYPETHPNRSSMWMAIQRNDNFYRDLDWTEDGEELWEAIRPLKPDILTGVSHGRPTSVVSRAKFEWCKRELCVEVGHRDMAAPKMEHKMVKKPKRDHCTVITCWSKNKHLENRYKDILIDDRAEKLRDKWEASGGIFVHHTSTRDTLRQLRELGVLSKHDENNQDNKSSGSEQSPSDKKPTPQKKEKSPASESPDQSG